MDKKMKKIKLDWAAPIFPGESMMGLSIGLSRSEVLDALQFHKLSEFQAGDNIAIQFDNSPLLLLDEKSDAIVLRDIMVRVQNSSTQDELIVMGFENDILVHLMASLIYGASLDYYRGKIFNIFGFGDSIAELANYCKLEFDSGDELFYSNDEEFKGLSVGGASCSLEDDPEQKISYIRVYCVND